MADSNVVMVNVSDIRENPVALRSVDRESEKFLGLKASIIQQGFTLSAISLRPRKMRVDPNDPNSEEVSYYEIIDGLQRTTIAKDLGLEKIPAIIGDLTDDQVLEAQIMANIHRVETLPSEYTDQLIRILKRNPTMTEAELATKLGKSTSWIIERLNLSRIKDERIKKLVDCGDIKLSNAYALSRLPEQFQAEMIDQALTLTPAEFLPIVIKRAQEIKEANRKGKDPTKQEFSPVAMLQKIGAIKTEQTNNTVAQMYVQQLGLKGKEADAFIKGAKLMMDWVLHVDPISIEEQKKKFDARIAEKEAAKKAKEAEKAEKKAKEAAEKAAELEFPK